jgi:transposase
MMYPALRLRPLSEEEARIIPRLARSQTASVRLVRRAQIVQLASQGKLIAEIAATLGCSPNVVRKWFKRFREQGLAGLEDAPRSGAPPRYTPETKARVIALARTRPSELGLPYSSWTFERLATYLHEHLGLQLKKTRIFEILQAEGLRWRKQETWFGERLDPEFAQKRGASRPSGPLRPPTASS